jgi:thioredoxin reductase (NADPH)
MLSATMSQYLIEEIETTRNLDVRLATEVVDGAGESRLEQLTLLPSETGETDAVRADALFIMIGAQPRTDWLPSEVVRDERGFVVTGADLRVGRAAQPWPLERPPLGFETSVPGVFAVGDVRSGSVKRVAAAVGEGSVVIQQVHSYLGAGAKAPRSPAVPP